MEVTYRVNLEDIHALTLYNYRTSQTLRRSFNTLRFAPPALTALLAFVIFSDFLFACVLAGVFGLYWILSYPRFNRKIINSHTQKLLKEGRNAALFCEHKIKIGEDALSVESELAQSRVSWAMVERVEETPEHIFIYIASLTAYAIPKWAFASARHAEEFFASARSFQMRGTPLSGHVTLPARA